MEHNLRRRAAKAVNRLVVVSDNHQILPLSGEHAHHFVLQTVDVLKLIHQNPGVAPGEGRSDVRPLFEELIAHPEHILVVDFPEFREPALIGAVHFPKLFRRTTHRIVVRKFGSLFLDERYFREHILHQTAEIAALRLFLPEHGRDQGALLLLADHLIRLIAVGGSQNAEKEGVKGPERDARPLPAAQFPVALLHLPRRGARKGQHQDGLRRHAALFGQKADALREHKGLSRARPRNDKKRSLPVGDRFSLRRI